MNLAGEDMAADSELSPLPREQTDRRRIPTSPWAAFIPGGRRKFNRRIEEHAQPYFVDQFPASTLAVVLLLLLLTILDGIITVYLLGTGCEEINPLMKYLLNFGTLPFLLGKYILTAAGLPLLLIFKNHYLFGTRFRVGYLLSVFVGMYLCLIVYQIFLIQGTA